MPTPEADVPVPPPPRQQGWETTTPTQEQAVRLQITPLLGLVTLADVNAADVRYLKQTLLDRGLAPDTVAYVQGVLSTALNQAVSDRLIPENPSRLVKRARSRTQKMRTLD